MPDLASAIADNRRAVASFGATCRRVPEATWLRPMAPGKWSPARVAEHVALSFELSTRALAGTFPRTRAPWFLRPLIRRFFLTPVLRNGRFGKGVRAPGVFQPGVPPATPEAGAGRIGATAAAFEAALEAEATAGHDSVNHPFFGPVALVDYLRLQTIHTNHHHRQLPGAGTP